jgi:hypothetical protein
MTAAELWSGSAWFVLFLLFMQALVRALPRHSPASIAVGSAVLFFALSLPLGLLLPISANYWRALALFGFLTIACLMVFGAVYKSISLRMLLELSRAPARRMPASQLLHRYVERESFEARVRTMIDQGLAVEVESGIALTANGRQLAAATQRVQTFYGIDVSG